MQVIRHISLVRFLAALAFSASVVLFPFHISFAFTTAQWQSMIQNQNGSPTVNVYAPVQYQQQYQQHYQYPQQYLYWCNGGYSYAPCVYYPTTYQYPTYYYPQPVAYYQDYSWYGNSYGSSHSDYSYDYYGQDYWY